LSHNGASDAQASVYLWVGVAIGIYVRAQVCKPGYCNKGCIPLFLPAANLVENLLAVTDVHVTLLLGRILN